MKTLLTKIQTIELSENTKAIIFFTVVLVSVLLVRYFSLSCYR